ncbi:MAG: class E sortase [Actinomycetota bacterium]|nr:class E sortase [Actinomycetota bacterium]
MLMLVWSLLVWQWQDPFTALYTKWTQRQLASQYDKRTQSFEATISGATVAAERESIAREAKRYRMSSKRGEVIGRLRVPRMGVNMLLVNGTDHDTLKKGPGRDNRTFMPGENRLVYIAGHRTTYLAPFSHIDKLRGGDRFTIEVPYGTFIYAVTRHRIVKSTDLSVLRSPRHELIELQACHPRFFASHRYIAYAKLLRVEPRGAKPYELAAQASAK